MSNKILNVVTGVSRKVISMVVEISFMVAFSWVMGLITYGYGVMMPWR